MSADPRSVIDHGYVIVVSGKLRFEVPIPYVCLAIHLRIVMFWIIGTYVRTQVTFSYVPPVSDSELKLIAFICTYVRTHVVLVCYVHASYFIKII